MDRAALKSLHADTDRLIEAFYVPSKFDPFKVEESIEKLIVEFFKQNPQFNMNNEVDAAICARLRFRAKQIADKARYEHAMGVIC